MAAVPPSPHARFKGCLLGLAIGDAVGTSVEFRARETFPPLTDMLGGGPFNLLPGQWTDDTSMALCLAVSLLEKAGFDANDQMERYWQWFQEGYLSSTGACFDIGTTVASALHRYQRTGNAYAGSSSPDSAGNGCIMRLAPIPMYFFPDMEATERFAEASSRTTHQAPVCLDACRLLARILFRALSGVDKTSILLADQDTFEGSAPIKEIAQGKYFTKDRKSIRGSGYVVESLEAALWAFYLSTNFSEAVLLAANLGDDADTTAAICGQVAGAYYGEEGIPPHWLHSLFQCAEIISLADQFAAKAGFPNSLKSTR